MNAHLKNRLNFTDNLRCVSLAVGFVNCHIGVYIRMEFRKEKLHTVQSLPQGNGEFTVPNCLMIP